METSTGAIKPTSTELDYDRDASLKAFASDAEPNEALRLAARAHLEQPTAETQAELSEACLTALVQQAQELKMGY